MQTAELILWIADLTGDSERRRALQDGRELTGQAQHEALIDAGEAGVEALAQLFAEALEDDWLTCDYEGWPGDNGVPPRYPFGHLNLQRCRNIRITRSVGSRSLSCANPLPSVRRRRYQIARQHS